MYLYLVMRHVGYDADYMEGVYTTIAKANKRFDSIVNSGHRSWDYLTVIQVEADQDKDQWEYNPIRENPEPLQNDKNK